MRIACLTVFHNRIANGMLWDCINGMLRAGKPTGVDGGFVLVNNGSTEDFSHIRRALSQTGLSYEIIDLPENNGPIQGSMKVIGPLIAKGYTHFAMCDSDDIWMPEFLVKTWDCMMNTKVDYVSTYYQLFGTHNRVIEYVENTSPMDMYSNGAPPSSGLYSAKYFEVTGGWKEEMRYAHDFECHLNAALKGLQYAIVKEPLYMYRQHGNQETDGRWGNNDEWLKKAYRLNGINIDGEKREKRILISNFHQNGTQAIVDDFVSLGYNVCSPIDDWNGRATYHSGSSVYLEKTTLISHDEFLKIRPTHVLLGCFEQYTDFTAFAFEVGAKRIVHVAGNDYPMTGGEYLICPDRITFDKYAKQNKCPNRMMYFSQPIIRTNKKKDIEKSFGGEISSFILHYREYWKIGFELAQNFRKAHLANGETRCCFYGEELILSLQESQDRIVDCFFQLYFKDRDCWGNSVLESMWLGTPVIAYEPFIKHTSMGLLLNHSNSIIVGSVDEALSRVSDITLDEYRDMSERARMDVMAMCDKEKRLSQMKAIGL